MDTVFKHFHPYGWSQATALGYVNVAPKNHKEQFEELWLAPYAEGSFVITCIPHVALGFAFGDVVLVEEVDNLFHIKKRIKPSSYITYNLSFQPDAPFVEISLELKSLGILKERITITDYAVAVPLSTEKEFLSYTHSFMTAGILRMRSENL